MPSRPRPPSVLQPTGTGMKLHALKLMAALLFLGELSFSSIGCASRPLDAIEDVPEGPTPIHYAPKTTVEPTPQLPRVPVIPRYIIEAVQAEGPGRLLQRVPVRPFRAQGQFMGFQIVDLFPGENIRTNHIQAGDVVTRINGRRVDRPEQFMRLFQDLHMWETLEIELLRGEIRKTVVFQIR